MTEVLSVADIELATLDEVGAGRGVCVGRPLAGVGIRIEPLAGGDGETGEIIVSAPWQSPATTASGRRPTTRACRRRGVEWHRTGDVGHLDADGRLWVEGRLVQSSGRPTAR